MKYVYMNHRIKMKKPDGPVIVVHSETEKVEANAFEIIVGGKTIGVVDYDPRGLKACRTHEVRAWVNFSDDVELRPFPNDKVIVTPHPTASAKEPNRKVKVSK
jgi:hypothetical protein